MYRRQRLSLHDLSESINMGTLMQRSEVTPTHISSPRFTPQPPVSVFYVSICFGRGQLDVWKPPRWAGLGSPILVGDERDASAVRCVVCFKSGYERLPRNSQGTSPAQRNRREKTVFWSNGRHGCTRSLRVNISNPRTFIFLAIT